MFLAAQIDVAATITALAGLVTAAGWAYTQWRTHSAVRRVETSVGSTNGTDLATMGAQITTLEGYTHDSIHELRGTLTPIVSALPKLTADVTAIKAEQERIAATIVPK